MSRITNGSERRGIAGVLATLIVFAMLLTVGVSYFMTINSFKHQQDVAANSNLALASRASLENLSMSARLVSGAVGITLNNTGSTAVSIVSIFLTDNQGKLISSSHGSPSSPFLTGVLDLNETLPLTLSPGATTKGTDDITVFSSSFAPATRFLVSAQTSLGNVFSVEYPPIPMGTLKNVLVVNQNLVNQVPINQQVVDVSGQTVIVGCYQCLTILNSGGNILVLQLVATPSPVADAGTITLTATVWNYSPYTASQMNVSVGAVYSGSASVTPDVSSSNQNCGTIQSITSMNSIAVVCTFTAHAGGSGGAVTFSGVASACILTGTTLDCNNGSIVSSATSGSNPVEVGAIQGFGPWQLNYYYFDYTDQTHQTPTPVGVISSSDHYVAFYVKLTNVYNKPLTLLDGSWLQFISPGTDIGEYVILSAPSYSGTPSFTAYGCTDSAPNPPTDIPGQSCITVNPGQTVNIYFAASKAGSSSWEWGSGSSPAGSGYGLSVQISLTYAMSVAGQYKVYGDDIAFESVYIN